MIPDFQPNGELPPGEHAATLDEIEFFQTNRDGNPKGIIRIDLSELT